MVCLFIFLFFSVNFQITWADIAIFSILENMEGFQIHIQDYVTDSLPKLKAIQDKVASEPRIAAWLKKRPVTTL